MKPVVQTLALLGVLYVGASSLDFSASPLPSSPEQRGIETIFHLIHQVNLPQAEAETRESVQELFEFKEQMYAPGKTDLKKSIPRPLPASKLVKKTNSGF